MKKLLTTLCLITISLSSFASHVLGGEIGWKCLPNGQYIFTMAIYRDCTGIQWTFRNETIGIQGSPLPTNGVNGPVVNTITMKPDRVRFQSNSGDLSPYCTPGVNQPYSCANRDPGTVQAFTYNSDPVTLSGTPPSSGWKFFWESPCCRPNNIENVNTTGRMLLRATMYPLPGGVPADPCFDSSPIFKALPTPLICRGQEFIFNPTAIDDDLDSLAYSWDRPYNPPQGNPNALTYKTGFSPTNPTPDQSFDSNNIPASLDSITGITQLAVYSGTGTKKYIIVIKVDSYREGHKIATVFREYPILIFDCPGLPGTASVQNNPPKVNLNGLPVSSIVVSAVAGQTVTVPVLVTDNDQISVAPFRQEITMTPDGLLFTQSKTGPSKKYSTDSIGEPCIVLSKDVHPCAYLRNSDPIIDVNASPPVAVIKGLGVINTEFVWQTNCNHVQSRYGFPGTNEGVFNFVLRVQDDHCPIPGINYPTITVKVTNPIPLEEPIMKGISVHLDGTTSYSWVPPIDSANQFNSPNQATDHYESTFSTPWNSQGPSFWVQLHTYIKNYKQDKRSTRFSPYNLNNVFDPNSGYNILESAGAHINQNSDYYLRMRTLSGCTDTNASIWSEPARIMELNATDGSTVSQLPRSATRLTWNRAKPLIAKTYPYFIYESPTNFFIHINDSFASGKLQDSASWYIGGSTYDTTYTIGGGACNEFIAYRIEARDTVVSWKQGSSLRSDSLDTLYFSTFSTVDTFYLNESRPDILNNKFISLQSNLNRSQYSWWDCGSNSLIQGASGKHFSPTKQGTYKVIVADNLSNTFCNDTSNCFTTVPVQANVSTRGIDYLRSSGSDGISSWYDCDLRQIISGANKNYFVPTKAGRYAAIKTIYSYSDTSNCINTVILSNSVTLSNNDSLHAKMSGVYYQWFNCSTNLPIAGATLQNYKPQDTGYYKVVVSAYGYSDTSVCIPVLAIGLYENNFNQEVSFYPNPTNGTITVRLAREAQNISVQIRNIQGLLVQKQQFKNQSNFEVDIQGSSGIYFIQLTNEKGERANLKVVKN